MDEHTRNMMAALAYVIAQLKQESWHYQEVVQKYDRMTDDDLMRNDYNKIIQDELAEAKAEIEKLGRICEEKDAKITELRQELQANKDADTLLCDENRRLLESLTAKDAEIAKLREEKA